MFCKFFIITLLLFISPLLAVSMDNSNKVTVFTYHKKQSKDDKRFEYDHELLKLSLEKTIKKYGAYKLVPLSVSANYKRIEMLTEHSSFENIIFKHSVSKERLTRLGYIPFPVDLGIVGYRVGFVSKKNKSRIESIKNLNELKKISIVQGLGWLDKEILENSGFKVITGSSYSGLFKMLVRNRGDLFLRGANELYEEWQTHKNIGNLSYDESLVIYYPLPRFFFTSKKNKEAIKRIHEGLILAYNDGSLMNLWKKHYLKSVKFANLKNRKIYKFENPFLEDIDRSYEKYIYIPKSYIE